MENIQPTQDRILTAELLYRNPAGQGSSHISSRQLIKTALIINAEKLIASNKIKVFKIYKVDKIFYVWMKVGSETFGKLFYDIVFKFFENPNSSSSLNSHSVSVFSNSPSFNYTYAYSYNKHGILLLPSLFNESIRVKPEIRNPYEEVGFEKFIFFAYHYLNVVMEIKKIDQLSTLRVEVKNFKTEAQVEKELLKEVINPKEQLARYNALKATYNQEKRRSRASANTQPSTQPSTQILTKRTSSITKRTK